MHSDSAIESLATAALEEGTIGKSARPVASEKCAPKKAAAKGTIPTHYLNSHLKVIGSAVDGELTAKLVTPFFKALTALAVYHTTECVDILPQCTPIVANALVLVNSCDEIQHFLDLMKQLAFLDDQGAVAEFLKSTDVAQAVCEAFVRIGKTSSELFLLQNAAVVLSFCIVVADRSELSCSADSFLKKSVKYLNEASNYILQRSSRQPPLASVISYHDNDFPWNFRNIQVLPTAEELQSSVDFVEKSVQYTLEPPTDINGFFDAFVDRQFRLLREDLVSPLKQEIAEELKAGKNMRLYPHPVFQCISWPGQRRASSPLVTIDIGLTPWLQARRKQMHKNEVSDFFRHGPGSKLFSDQSIVVLMDISGGLSEAAHPWNVVYVCTSTGLPRDEEGFNAFCKVFILEGTMRVSLRLPNDNKRSAKAATNFLLRISTKFSRSPCSHVFLSSKSFFSCAPILRRLQRATRYDLSFVDSVVMGQQPQSLLVGVDIPAASEALLRSDPSQLDAVHLALNSEIGLIQGPPGTGKTFVGVHLLNALFNQAEKPRVLLLCYTNHALDSFIELLLDALPQVDIKRLGTADKMTDRVKEHCCIQREDEGQFDRNQKRSYGLLMGELDVLRSQIDRNAKRALERFYDDFGKRGWTSLQSFLSGTEIANSQLYLDQLRFARGSFTAVGSSGKSVKEDYLYQEWYAGKQLLNVVTPMICLPPDHANNIWSLSKEERRETLHSWYKCFKEVAVTCFVESCCAFDKMVSILSNLKIQTKINLLRSADIIGCTTTFAAANPDLIKNSKRSVLVIEEAAEILESHVFVNFFSSVQHVIMIGDHKQLRPKLEEHKLRFSNPYNNFNFDVSMFERFVTKHNFPFSQLTCQHRMRDEFSSIVRLTYPDLQDHISAFGRENIRGLHGDNAKGRTNLIFVNHSFITGESGDVIAFDHPESSSGDAANGDTKSVMTNLHEAEMVSKTVRYLLQQGYTTDQIVVLTPYLAQLKLIQQALCKERLGAQIEELDAAELDKDLEAGIAKGLKVDESARVKIRVATVDNFQGEESDIVIASLVRCNLDRKIGWLKEPERVNVLFSRAKLGFILFGSMETLLSCRHGGQMFSKIRDEIIANGIICYGLPVVCEQHPEIRQLLRRPADFDELVVHGGCTQQCGHRLLQCREHSHVCEMFCHPLTEDGRRIHEQAPCAKLVPWTCPFGHEWHRKCCSDEGEPCGQVDFIMCARNLHKDLKVVCCRRDKPPHCTQKREEHCSNGHMCIVLCHEVFDQTKHCQDCKRMNEMLGKYPEITGNLRNAERSGSLCEIPLETVKYWTHNFEQCKVIGSGSTSTVYRVHVKLEAGVYLPLAIKKYKIGVGCVVSQADMALIKKEIRILSEYNNPHIIKIYGSCLEKQPCLILEDGTLGDLLTMLLRKPEQLTASARLRIGCGVAAGLNYLHSHVPGAPVFHLDVKSANIVLNAALVPKLIDCGVSKFAEADALSPGHTLAARTFSGVVGTPGYICRDEAGYVCTARSDIYSLGIVMLELLTGCAQSQEIAQNLCDRYNADADGSLIADCFDLWDKSALALFQNVINRSCIEPYLKRYRLMVSVLRDLRSIDDNIKTALTEELEQKVSLLTKEFLTQARLQEERRAADARVCQVCYDDQVEVLGGVECNSRGDVQHFVCGDCFSTQVKCQSEISFRGKFRENKKRIKCAFCAYLYTDVDIAKACTADAFELYQSARNEATLLEEKANWTREYREQLDREEMDKQGTSKERRYIEEEILTLHCPRQSCNIAIFDFEGCFAVSCDACRCGFCAWCLKDCGLDAHDHVKMCPKAPVEYRGGFHGRIESFDQVHKERRKMEVEAYLQTLPMLLREKVVPEIRKQLHDLGIVLDGSA